MLSVEARRSRVRYGFEGVDVGVVKVDECRTCTPNSFSERRREGVVVGDGVGEGRICTPNPFSSRSMIAVVVGGSVEVRCIY